MYYIVVIYVVPPSPAHTQSEGGVMARCSSVSCSVQAEEQDVEIHQRA